MYMVDGKRYATGSPEFIKWFEEDFEWLWIKLLRQYK
jgi:hypothetical protein